MDPLANPIRRPGPRPIRPPAMKCHTAAAFGPIPPPWGEPKHRVLPSGAASWQFRPQLRRSACQLDNFFVNGPEMTSITAARPYQRACAGPGQTPIQVFGPAPKRRSAARSFAAPVAAGGGWGATAPAATGLLKFPTKQGRLAFPAPARQPSGRVFGQSRPRKARALPTDQGAPSGPRRRLRIPPAAALRACPPGMNVDRPTRSQSSGAAPRRAAAARMPGADGGASSRPRAPRAAARPAPVALRPAAAASRRRHAPQRRRWRSRAPQAGHWRRQRCGAERADAWPGSASAAGDGPAAQLHSVANRARTLGRIRRICGDALAWTRRAARIAAAQTAAPARLAPNRRPTAAPPSWRGKRPAKATRSFPAPSRRPMPGDSVPAGAGTSFVHLEDPAFSASGTPRRGLRRLAARSGTRLPPGSRGAAGASRQTVSLSRNA